MIPLQGNPPLMISHDEMLIFREASLTSAEGWRSVSVQVRTGEGVGGVGQDIQNLCGYPLWTTPKDLYESGYGSILLAKDF